MKSLTDILTAVKDETVEVLKKNPPVDDIDPDELDANDLPDADTNTWFRVDEVVAVFADLQNSTQLGTGTKHAASTAAIYRAATGNVVSIYHDFEADFIQLQGDGAFGLFWGERATERAICAAITVKTFSEEILVPKLESRWEDDPETGFKVGLGTGRVLVKNIGTPRNEHEQEPVWAGKPVNYAAKAAQQASRHELIVTGSVWDAIKDNDYLTASCVHGDGASPAVLWEDVDIERLTHDEDEAKGRLLKAKWCDDCGPQFVKAILDGETTRDDAEGVRESAKSFKSAVWEMAAQRRQSTRAHKRGMNVRRR